MRRGRIVAIAGLAAGLGGCIVDTPPERPASENLRSPMRTLQLGNGMRVVLEQTPDFGAAAVVMAVGNGSAADPIGKEGLAHLVEHLGCQSVHGGAWLWDAVLEARANAYTAWDETVYHAVSDLGSLEETVALVYGAGADPLAGVDETTFARQRRIVESEVRYSTVEETPAEDRLLAAVFSPQHPYARPIGGTLGTVAGFTLADAQAYVAAYDRPSDDALVVVAPLPLDELRKMVERITGQTAREASSLAQTAASPTEIGTPRSYEVEEAPIASPRLWIGWSVPGSTKGSDLAYLAAEILGGLNHDLHERDPDILSLQAGQAVGKRAGLFDVTVVLKEGKHPEATARLVIDEIHGGLGRLGHEFGGFETMRNLFANRAIYLQENLGSRAEDLAWSTIRTGAPTFLAKRADRLLGLGPDDVIGYVQSFLSAERAHVVLLHPDAQEPPAPLEEPRQELRLAAQRRGGAVEGAGAASAAKLPIPHPLFGGVETHTLSNGLQVILLRRRGSLYHTVELGFRGGLAQATPPGVLTAAAWARRWVHPSPLIFGVSHRSWANWNATIETLRGVGTDVASTLGYLRDDLGFSVFWPPKDFTDRVKTLERESQMPEETLSRRMAHVLYGAQPLGVVPTAREIEKITPGELNRWLAHLRQPSNAVLVIVGDFNPASALAAAEKELGSWGANAKPIPPPADSPLRTELAEADRETVVYVDQPGTERATVRFECLLPKSTADDWGSRIVFRVGIANALTEALRENLGSTYAVRANVSVIGGGTTVFELETDVDYVRLPPALRRLREAIAGPVGAFVGQTALPKIEARTIRTIQTDGATSADWANELLFDWTHTWPLDLRDRVAAGIAATSREELERLTQHCRANGVVGLRGDEPRLRHAWEQATR